MEESDNNGMDIRQERRRFWRFLAISFGIAFAFLFFGKGTTVRQWLRARGEIHRQAKQKAIYLREIEEMDRQINQLKSSKDSLEMFAREKFRFAEKGDDVYIIR